eukprot:Amastigsp_a508954_358.p4 type:complete len:133 gc:universal Amastigsp_a508954_358:773-375(-)
MAAENDVGAAQAQARASRRARTLSELARLLFRRPGVPLCDSRGQEAHLARHATGAAACGTRRHTHGARTAHAQARGGSTDKRVRRLDAEQDRAAQMLNETPHPHVLLADGFLTTNSLRNSSWSSKSSSEPRT